MVAILFFPSSLCCWILVKEKEEEKRAEEFEDIVGLNQGIL